MPDTCNQCGFRFHESSLQLHRRLKNSTGKICNDCQRINRAENNEIKRNINKSRTSEEVILSKLYQLKKRVGYISSVLIQKKFGVGHYEAIQIADRINNNPILASISQSSHQKLEDAL